MKNRIIFTIILLATFGFVVQSQTDITEMNINGLKVIFKPSTKPTVCSVMFFKGGTANYPEKQQGIEDFALSATTECGTAKYGKDAFKDMADKYGINLGGNSGQDFGYISMVCVKPYWTEGWDLFSEAVNNPVFDAKEIALLQQKIVTGLKERESNPDYTLDKMGMLDAFKGTRYALSPEGTVESVSDMTQVDIQNYYKQLLNVNRMLLVVVGNLTKEEVKSKVESAFAHLPSTAISALPAPTDFRITENSLNVQNRPLATNYIEGIMGAPNPTTQDFFSYRLGINILSEKLFEEVRTKRNLSYAPYSVLNTDFIPHAELYVTTTKPKETVTVMVDEVKRLRDGGFTDVDLKDAKSKITTAFYMNSESTGSNAVALGSNEIKGSWKNFVEFLNKINAVTLPQMQKVFAEYADGIKWNYLGDESLADKEAFARSVK
jgi:predicted Zn-dependent peptidase